MSAQVPTVAGRLSLGSIASVALHGAAWTIGVYAISVALRFGSNVVLSRLIAPEIFGTILIIMTLRNGVDLLSDVGVGQNVVNNRNGDKPAFYNTAWTFQIIRGLVLFGALALAAPFLANIYEIPQSAILIGATTLAIMGFASTSVFMLQRGLRLARSNLFDLGQDIVSLTCTLVSAAISPTVWSLLVGSVIAVAFRTVTTFFLPHGRNRFKLRKDYLIEILSFGKWIYAWSLLGFLCMSFDRLYLGHAASLAVLGVYGIARTIAELPVALAGRLGHSLIFPLISSMQSASREELRSHLAPLRFKFLMVGAVCLAFGITFADHFVELLYDDRYHGAGWMLPVLLMGGWAAVLCSVGEYTLLGLGKPLYGAGANCTKLVYLAVALPLAFGISDVFGAILAIASAELVRYVALFFGQVRERISFWAQDALATATLLAIVLALAAVRQALEMGDTFDGAPVLWQ